MILSVLSAPRPFPRRYTTSLLSQDTFTFFFDFCLIQGVLLWVVVILRVLAPPYPFPLTLPPLPPSSHRPEHIVFYNLSAFPHHTHTRTHTHAHSFFSYVFFLIPSSLPRLPSVFLFHGDSALSDLYFVQSHTNTHKNFTYLRTHTHAHKIQNTKHNTFLRRQKVSQSCTSAVVLFFPLYRASHAHPLSPPPPSPASCPVSVLCANSREQTNVQTKKKTINIGCHTTTILQRK